MRKAKKSKSKGIKILVVILVLLIIVASTLLGLKIMNDKKNGSDNVISLGTDEGVKAKPEEKIKIFQGNNRPIAVMIDNHKGAWPQAGLTKAYMVYEILAEGGETRLMAVFKGVDVDKIGPIRSSRHYYLDYALENNAIYVHYGWSPQAESDIGTLNVNNINGISQSDKEFWRIKQKASPHNVLTSTENIKKIAGKKSYATTSTSKSVLNYKATEVNLESEVIANEVKIPFSTLHTTSYKYDETTKRYTRYARGEKQTDFETKEPITTKNIIITFAENYQLSDPENKDRQGLKNIGTKDGYYITNGKAIKITCTKDSRSSKTIYKDEAGNEINVNDGNTYINICPLDAKVVIE